MTDNPPPGMQIPLTVRRAALELLAVAVAVLVFYAPHLNPNAMQTGGDFAGLFWPGKELRLQAIADAGVLPLWNPHAWMGSPFAATMQHGVFYPVEYLFFFGGSALPGMNLYLLFHLLLAGAGAWWWMRGGWRAGAAAAITAGVLFPCVAWFQGAQEHINQIATAAWLPWLLAEAVRFGRGHAGARGFVLRYSMLAALQFLAGHPQAAFYTHLAAAGLLAAFAIRHGKSQAVRFAAAFMGAGALTGLLVAVQLLPALELSGQSYRVFSREDAAYSLHYSMPPEVLVTYALPNAFGTWRDGHPDGRLWDEYGLYVGMVTLLLAGAGAVALWQMRRRRLLAFLAAGVVLTLLLAMGGNTAPWRIASGEFTEMPPPAETWAQLSLHEVFVAIIPPAKGFRVPARITVLTALALITLAGFGVGWLLAVLSRRANRRVAIAVVVLAIAGSWTSLYLSSLGRKWRAPADSELLQLAIADTPRPETPTLDNRLFRLTVADHELLMAERDRATAELAADALGQPLVLERWERRTPSMNAVAQVPLVEGYEEGLLPTVRTKDFLFAINRNLRRMEPDTGLAALLGLSGIAGDLPVNEELYPVTGVFSRGTAGAPPFVRRDAPLSRGAAFWRAQADGADFAALEGPYFRGEGLLGARATEPVDWGALPQWNAPLPRIRTDVTNPNRVVLQSDGEAPGDALLAMGYAPGWTAAGEPLEWISAVHAVIPQEAFDATGQAIAAYEPRSFRHGFFLTALGLGLWTAIAVSGWRRREKP